MEPNYNYLKDQKEETAGTLIALVYFAILTVLTLLTN